MDDPNVAGQAGNARQNWYSFDTGDAPNKGWHVVVLSTECKAAEPPKHPDPKPDCNPSDYQDTGYDVQLGWLNKDLAATDKPCTMVAWHEPVYYAEHETSKGELMEVENQGFRDTWKLLANYGADVNLTGHHHYYARLLPHNADGLTTSTDKGMAEFQAGMGGKNFYSIGHADENAANVATTPDGKLAVAQTFGILEMKLGPDSYGWNFAPAKYNGPAPAATNAPFTDSGSGVHCRAKDRSVLTH